MKLFLCFLFLCSSCIIYAQTTISGMVVNAETEEPVYGANVIINNNFGVATDSEGRFELQLSVDPPFQLEISKVGYLNFLSNIESKNVNIQVKLVEKQTQLDEIVIAASRTPERIFESPVSIERMGGKDFENTTSADFYSGLENLKGVDINSSSLTFKSINTRGFATFSNTRFVQLVDGIENVSPALNFVMGNLLGMSELDVNTIELLPGASSALYGANAFNGVLSMKSKNPFDHQGVSYYAKAGITSQKAAGENEFLDVGVRVARAFSKKFAAKMNFSLMKGTDWYAVDYVDYNNPTFTRTNPGYDGLNVYGDEVATTLNFRQIALGAGVPANLAAMMEEGLTVSRSGYNEADLLDYNARSMKADLSLNFRPNEDDLEIIYLAKLGGGSTVYQSANRYSLNDFILFQQKLEVKNDHFFVRASMTGENAGDSYDARFTAININRAWKSDRQWFTDYANGYIATFLTQLQTTGAYDIAQVHQAARAYAQTGALVPGTVEFNNAFDKVTSDSNLNTGSKFVDKSRMYHVDGNYNLSHIINFAEIQVGGSWRKYSLNSSGTIFTDYEEPITYSELGAYVQVQKKMFNNRLKFTGSLRYDKAKNFDGHFSPRLSLIHFLDKRKKHNVRFSFQTGFRNPTTQDQYIGLDVGRAILVGSAKDNLDRYVSSDLNVSPVGQQLGMGSKVNLSGRDAYENAFTLSSVLNGLPVKADVDLVKPEKVKAFEIGYRGELGKIAIDLSYYHNSYEDFIGNKTVVVPYYGRADLSDVHSAVNMPLALIAMGNGDYKPFQVYTNSSAEISSNGVIVGLSGKIYQNFQMTLNYCWSDYSFNQSTDPDYEASFNTPEHKVKFMFGNEKVWKNLGFNLSLRWHNKYLWESSFADGYIDANTVVDAQVSYALPKLKSTLKIGGTNIGGNEYFNAPGTGHIGSMYYISFGMKL
ncbi:TonB-dependent receptor [Prolixibacteraceae bacterium JC049]|nr:TonB-dependent receptor [Prolixibacteraceae bacterium JC049]